ncbi:hypothetical protein J4734_25570, partial [Klebsiella pneumoniae]|nr:hypothetical protein [Klebsiella pneumoniae]
DILPIICKFKFIQKVIKQKSMLFKRFRGAAPASSIGKFENKVFAVFDGWVRRITVWSALSTQRSINQQHILFNTLLRNIVFTCRIALP